MIEVKERRGARRLLFQKKRFLDARTVEQGGKMNNNEVPAWLDALSYWMDERFRIPGTSWRIGLDGIIGLLPGIGDTAAILASLFILVQARRMNIGKMTQAKIFGYALIDFVIGSIPLVGDLFDFGFKSNKKSVQLLRKELKK